MLNSIKNKLNLNKPQSGAGFTLIELLVVISLLAVSGLVISDLFIAHHKLYRSETAELSITNDARVALDDVDNYVRQAHRTQASYSTYTASANTLILQIQSINASNQLIGGTYDNVVYYLISGSLFRQVFPNVASSRVASTKNLASNVSSLVFTYNNVNYDLVTSLAVDLVLQASGGLQNRTISASAQARLRNY